MPRCAYCLKDATITTFNGTEHVVPYSLGRFTPLNPTIKGDLVCDNCNSVVFNKLESNFKEDSYEGLVSQLFNLEGHSNIRLRGKNVSNIKFEWGFDDKFFESIFPVLKIGDGIVKAYPISQIQLKNFDGVYQIFFPEALEKIKNKKSEFIRLKQRISGLKDEDILIFTGGKSEEESRKFHETAIALLKDFGKGYNQKESKYVENTSSPSNQYYFDCEFSIDQQISRLIAKIAFNYFLFCLKQSQLEKLAYHENFNKIRSFILGEESIRKEDLIKPFSRDAILHVEKEGNKRFIAHMLAFSIIDGTIVAHLTLFGGHIYDIFIGNPPMELVRNDFGCGHIFDPFKNQIINIAQTIPVNPTEEQMKTSFGVFKRIL